jgi:hypothetical protein
LSIVTNHDTLEPECELDRSRCPCAATTLG